MQNTCVRLIILLFSLFIYGLSFFTLAYADVTLTDQDKMTFNSGVNIGRMSYLLSDVTVNNNVMGVAVLNNRLSDLYKVVLDENNLEHKLNINRKVLDSSGRILKQVAKNATAIDYDREEMKQALNDFTVYSSGVKDEIKRIYGIKGFWLFSTGVLAGFTEISMDSEYAKKLVMANMAFLLDEVPYSLPTSITSSITNLITIRDPQLTSPQIDLMKESAENVIRYFNSPETYAPPVTLKEIVGQWKGRVSTPDGLYHKALLVINPDLSGYIDLEGFSGRMPVRSVTLTQSSLAFDMVPYSQDQAIIRFIGKIADDMATGEAVDISGKKGLWQFIRVAPETLTTSAIEDFVPEKSCLDRYTGEWKGKILEESGSITESTLFFNLKESSILVVENGNLKKTIKIGSIAANDSGIRFVTVPDENKLSITFVGKLNGQTLEGSAKANDGTRGYWKLVKVFDKKDIGNKKSKIKLNYYNFKYGEMYDPVVEGIVPEDLILVADVKSVDTTMILPKGRYKGLLYFDDGTNAQITLQYDTDKTELLLKENDGSQISLPVSNFKILNRTISFKTNLDGTDATEVFFEGKIIGDYIYGIALNKSNKELSWEVMSLNKLNNLIEDVKEHSNEDSLQGIWHGQINYGSHNADVIFDFAESKRKIVIDDPNAKDGRLTLNVGSLVKSENKAVIKATALNNKTPVELRVEINDKTLKGYLKSQENKSKQLNIRLYKSDLSQDIIDSTLNEEKVSVENKARYLFRPESDAHNTVNTDADTGNTAQNQTEQQLTKDEKDNNHQVSTPEVSTTLNIIVTDDNNRTTIQKPSKNDTLSDNKVENSETKTDSELNKVESKPVSNDLQGNENLKSPDNVNVSDSGIEFILGKWVGELETPQKDKGEIIVEFKPSDSYMYIDKAGEKVSFKLFDFSIADKEISFKIKPSAEADYGIAFKGKWIEGVISGTATDPSSSKGKWYIKKLQ